MMMTKSKWSALMAAAILAAAIPARAQDSPQQTVSDVIGFLMTNQAVETSEIERDRDAADIARDTITRALLLNLTSVPLASSSSGFLYRLNPELGTVERATDSFGSFFVERALTAGRGRASFTIVTSTSGFSALDGFDLREGSLVTIATQFVDEPAPFDTEALTLRIRSNALTILGNVGVTDNFEIGAAVPLVDLSIEGERINLYRGNPFQQAAATASASGLADIAVRAKYTIFSNATAGVAVAGEVRLPTGDEENLLGAGSTAMRIIGIAAGERGRWTFAGNGGIVRGGVSDEWLFAGAVSGAVDPRFTVTGELSLRHIAELRPIQLTTAPHARIDDVNTLRLTAGDAGRTLTTAITGIKWNATGTLVLGAHIRWNIGDAGLTAPLTPSVSMEYAFSR
jgi:hypothetical protein